MIIPDQIPLMPLSGSVLFPGTVLPLYLFEPRYRRMLQDVLEGSRCFAVGMIRPGVEEEQERDPTFRIVGAGLVRAAVRNNDQTGHLLLLGVVRVRIDSLVETRPYRTVRIARLKDRLPPNRGSGLAERASATIAAALEARREIGEKAGKELVELLLSIRDPARLTDTAAFYLLAEPAHRQAILETLDVEQRIEQLRDLLAYEFENPAAPSEEQGDNDPGDENEPGMD